MTSCHSQAHSFSGMSGKGPFGLPEAPRGRGGGRRNRRHHGAISSNLGVCVLTKLGAYDNITNLVNFETLKTNLIDNSSLTTEQKGLAATSFDSCISNTTTTLSEFLQNLTTTSGFGRGFAHRALDVISQMNNNVTKALFCSTTSLLQNGCATNSSGSANSTGQTSAKLVQAKSGNLAVFVAADDVEIFGQLQAVKSSLCDPIENTESDEEDDNEDDGFYDGYHAPKPLKALSRRLKKAQRRAAECNTTEENEINTPTTVASLQ